MPLWLLCLFGPVLRAQHTPRLRNFTPSEYNGQNQNWSLAQAAEGWVYACNNGFLLEYDGARWQQFHLPEHQTPRTVAVGPDGAVYCGGFAEFGYWKRGANGQLSYTSLSKGLQSARLRKEEIWHILVTEKAVYFQSFSVLYKYDYRQVTEMVPPAAIMFATEIGGRIWVPTIGKGLFELLPDGRFEPVPGTAVLNDKIVQFLVPNGKGGLWAGTSNNGIFDIQNGACTPWQHPLNQVFRQFQLNKALALKDGGWVFGTILGGLYIIDAGQKPLYWIHRPSGLQNNTVLSLLEDREGNVWAGLDKGIDLIQLRSPLSYFIDEAGTLGTAYSATEWEGYLYLGTNQGVFSRPLTGGPFQLVEGSQGQVWQLQVFGGQLLCGHNGGTFVIEGRRARRISDITGGWCTLPIPGRADILLQSTYTGLICFIQAADGHWRPAHRVEGFTEPLREIAFGQDGGLWGTHPNWGLYRLEFDPEYRKVIRSTMFTVADGLPADFHLGLSAIDGHIYINTERWPFEPVFEQGKWRFVNQEANGSTAYKLLAGRQPEEYFKLDSAGIHLVQTGGKGTFFPVKLVPRYEHIVYLPDSSYLFCLENGYAVYQLSQVREADSPQSPVPYIRYVEHAEGSILPAGVPVTLPYRLNNVKVVFATPGFERPAKYSWFMEGFSKRWSAWQTAGEKEFTNLPEGRYVFRVKDDMSGREAVLEVVIQPPWYRSALAYLLYIVLFLLAIWQFERFNRRRLERQRRRLETEKEREILKLEVENKNRELSNAALNLIRKNEALQGLKDELMGASNDNRSLQRIARHIDAHLEGDHDWEIFEASFNRVHDDFFKRLMQRYPELTPGDLRLAAYLKMNLSSKEIAPLLNISIRGIENKRYRLRKKLGLPEEANLTEFIMNF